MKLIMLEGNVVGGHRIEDLGLTVPYKQQVRVLWDRVNWSRDLSFALMNNLVSKREIVTTPLLPPQAYVSPSQMSTNVESRPTLKAVTVPVTVPVPQDSNELRELRESNANLILQMGKLMAKMDEMISAPPSVVHVAGVATSNTQGQSYQTTNNEAAPDYIEDEPVMYVPSKIRSDKTKVSEEIQVESESSKGKSLDAAAEALKAMKQPRRRKKSE